MHRLSNSHSFTGEKLPASAIEANMRNGALSSPRRAPIPGRRPQKAGARVCVRYTPLGVKVGVRTFRHPRGSVHAVSYINPLGSLHAVSHPGHGGCGSGAGSVLQDESSRPRGTSQA